MKIPENKNYKLSYLQGEIVRLEITVESELSRDHVEEYLRAVDRFYKGLSLPLFLIIIPGTFAISFSAMMRGKNNRGAKRMAVITKKKPMASALQLTFQIINFGFPIQFFDNEDSGKKWLLED